MEDPVISNFKSDYESLFRVPSLIELAALCVNKYYVVDDLIEELAEDDIHLDDEIKNSLYTNTISLDPEQELHLWRMMKRCDKYRICLDCSQPGAGKSHSAMKMCQINNKIPVVICEPNMETQWKEYFFEYLPGVDYEIITYNSLRVKPNHPGSTKKRKSHVTNNILDYVHEMPPDVLDETNEQQVNDYNQRLAELASTNEGNFVTTPYFKEICKQGCIVIIDEGHNLKNETIQREACVAITDEVHLHENSCILILTGTPSDQTDVEFLLRLANLVHRGKDYDSLIKGVLKKCYDIDAEAAKMLDDMYNISAGQFRPEQHIKFMRHVVKAIFTPNMTSAILYTHPPQIVKNMFLPMDGDDLAMYRKALEHIESLKKLSKERARVQRENKIRQQRGQKLLPEVYVPKNQMSRQYQLVESCKINPLACFVTETLKTRPNTKLIISLNAINNQNAFIDIMRQVQEECGIGICAILGNTPKKKRTLIKDLFQEPNLDVRVLISSIPIIGTGINLDDTDGRFPRILLISSSGKFLRNDQGGFRICRRSTKSKSEVYYLYGPENDDKELKLYRSMGSEDENSKGALLNDVLPEKRQHVGDYEKMIFRSSSEMKKYISVADLWKKYHESLITQTEKVEELLQKERERYVEEQSIKTEEKKEKQRLRYEKIEADRKKKLEEKLKKQQLKDAKKNHLTEKQKKILIQDEINQGLRMSIGAYKETRLEDLKPDYISWLLKQSWFHRNFPKHSKVAREIALKNHKQVLSSSGDVEITFGELKGLTVAEAFIKNKYRLHWYIKQDWMEDRYSNIYHAIVTYMIEKGDVTSQEDCLDECKESKTKDDSNSDTQEDNSGSTDSE